uniref:Uncharacterized protein n=1 Tax=Anguilla anguilla TaxID=7936 RepID=A0A0E9XEN0_ANGAN
MAGLADVLLIHPYSSHLSPVHLLQQGQRIGHQDLLTALMKQDLQVVVLQDLDQRVSEVGDLHALLDTTDEDYGVHVSPDVI